MAVGLMAASGLGVVKGIRLASVEAGIRYTGRRDLTLIELAAGSVSAATFTRNAFTAAPVIVAREHLQSAAPRYLLINTGNANAATGVGGLDDARRSCALVANVAGCEPQEVLPFSTGVIGERLPLPPFEAGIPAALNALSDNGWEAAAAAIMTTDTVPKGVFRDVPLSGGAVRIVGIAKGSGMIRPDMATMLAFLGTDLVLAQDDAQRLLSSVVEQSFNRVTVDGDTSTNDACVLSATGQSGVHLSGVEDEQTFREALFSLMLELAQALVRDGEGASKFITVRVEAGATTAECLQVAYTVAHSPLVKTAMFASDPNWGRLVM
ncbi:MAG: bifunctional glutamate N-acetyltransferase/amino-acid acetyltransferase ArgJ, partial [Chromatiales bacterium]|nr:bifunctional glutamate N-acetyltransferase/amino-acid acetyltransferase ArgJ [Chromatiales bacterium]